MPKRRRARYPSDLTDSQWAVVAPMIPDATSGGRPRKAEKREIVEAILYFLRAGCAWRLLPHDFPPWQTVYYYLRRWEREGVWAGVLHTLVMADRERAGAGRRRPRRRSSTARRSGRPIKRGMQRL